ncbi:MAG: hypothetical protein BWK76_20195 [Desulfobulbaceae bacterium A2]|nr:MAG: hypothetical protein BWK76_20195 [Desulfobulbaceae bacterium A2]
MTSLLLVRHADVGPAYRGRLVGSADVPATRAGLAELTRLRPLLRELRPDACLVSPCQRTRQSWRVLRAGHSLSRPAVVEPLLREIDFGQYELRSFDELAAADPDLARRWQRPDFAFPGGESLAAFHRRLDTLLTTLEQAPAEKILLVTHGGVIRHLLCRLLGVDPANYLLFSPRYAGLTCIEHVHQGHGVLTAFNL